MIDQVSIRTHDDGLSPLQPNLFYVACDESFPQALLFDRQDCDEILTLMARLKILIKAHKYSSKVKTSGGNRSGRPSMYFSLIMAYSDCVCACIIL